LVIDRVYSRTNADKPNQLDFAHYPVEVSMTRRFASLRRSAALSVAITLFWAPTAAAQSPEAAPPIAAPSNTTLLTEAAFARLVQPPPADVAPAPVVADSPRPSLLRQGTTAMAREARATAAKAQQQGSWVSRHKVLTGVLTGVAVTFVALTVCWFACEE
jgi:hypothetical protein